jgi:hypothetical protein
MIQKIFPLFIASCLLFTLSSYSSGAVLPVSSPFRLGNAWYSKTDTWYSIKQDRPDISAYARSISPDFSVIGGEYYQNDQTFADLYFQNIAKSDLTYFGGSYLFKSGFFAGLNYLNVDPTTETLFSPGYRFKVKKNGYVAVSFDYLSNDYSNTHDIVNYDVDFKLFPQNMKISGEISLPKEGNDTLIYLNGNYKLNKHFVAGADYMSQGSDNAYSAGFTYTVQSFVIDATLGKTFNQNYYQFAGMDNLKKFSLGALYQKYQNDSNPGLTIQGKYHLTKADLILKYTFQNDSYDQATVLAYEKKL